MGFPGSPAVKANQRNPPVWVCNPQSTGRPAGARSCVAKGGGGLEVSHSELRAPGGKAWIKNTAGRDRTATSKNLGAGSDLDLGKSF